MQHDDLRDEADRRVRSALQSAFEKSAPLAPRPEFVAELTTRLRAAASHPPSRSITMRSVLTIAASIVVVGAAALGLRQWVGVERFWELARAAVGDHRNCALQFRLTERPIPLDEAARRFDPMYESLIAVQPSPLPVAGEALTVLERHSCVFEGRRFAHLVLKYRGSIVSVLVSADRFAATPSPPESLDGLRVASFRQAGYVVLVVSPLGDEETRLIAQAIGGPILGALAIARVS